MPNTSANHLRRHFIDYFRRASHTEVKSAPLVPQNDPTLMFTNAGMVQFKDLFTGAETRDYRRAVTSQKCMRVSGKHNDLEEVGRTARHHTFFEMLGNFSFGDYFKDEAIELAWTFLIKELEVSKDRLWITVFGGEQGIAPDSEARTLWKKVSGFSDERVLDMGMKDNFWAMGDTGPCGPCTEIHFDLRNDRSSAPTPEDFSSGAVMEIWNNVFMQFERRADGTLTPLPAPSVDTGMGLERLASVVQGVDSNYHTDLFLPLIEHISDAAHKRYQRSGSDDDISIRVIADHARATAFLVADGVQPNNEGRGYVMRRIMRRAIRHGKRLGFDDLFFASACSKVVDIMGEAYPELREAKVLIEKVADLEEQGFRRTLASGLNLLEQEIASTKRAGGSALTGEAVFKLYDTYGFPRDLTEVIAAEHQLTIDEVGFERAMEAQRERSRGGEVGEAAVEGGIKVLKEAHGPVRFIGYTHEDTPLSAREGTWRRQEAPDALGGGSRLEVRTKVCGILVDGRPADGANEGVVEVVLDPTPFYGESGGQVGDQGVIEGEDDLLLEVIDTQKPLDDFIVSRARVLRGSLRVGDEVWAGYDPEVRKMTRAHHSATHLLHGALRQVLGDHVKQAGSLVDPDHLRFDYAHFEAPSVRQLEAVEEDANRRVREAHDVITEELPFDQAKAKGAIAMFGEKYGDRVRVLSMGESVEFCGGTHVQKTSDIGFILLTREEAVQSGVRRLEAEVGAAAQRRVRDTYALVQTATALLRGEQVEPGDNSVLRAIAKATRNARALADELQGAVTLPNLEKVSAPSLGEPIGLRSARTIRDLWNGLVLLSNTKGSEAVTVARGFIEQHPEVGDSGLLQGFADVLQFTRDAERIAQKAKTSAIGEQVNDLLREVREINGVAVLSARLDGVDAKALRTVADQVRDKLRSGVVLLCAVEGEKVALLVAVSKDLTTRFKAGDLVRELAPLVGGRGGGKPELAQAGGSDAGGISRVFERLTELVQSS